MPTLDLHGQDRVSAIILLREFINDNIKLRNREIAVIHGIGKGILKKEVHSMLKHDKRIGEFGTDYFNTGCTLVRIKEVIDKKSSVWYNTQHQTKGEN